MFSQSNIKNVSVSLGSQIEGPHVLNSFDKMMRAGPKRRMVQHTPNKPLTCVLAVVKSMNDQIFGSNENDLFTCEEALRLLRVRIQEVAKYKKAGEKALEVPRVGEPLSSEHYLSPSQMMELTRVMGRKREVNCHLVFCSSMKSTQEKHILLGPKAKTETPGLAPRKTLPVFVYRGGNTGEYSAITSSPLKNPLTALDNLKFAVESGLPSPEKQSSESGNASPLNGLDGKHMLSSEANNDEEPGQPSSVEDPRPGG